MSSGADDAQEVIHFDDVPSFEVGARVLAFDRSVLYEAKVRALARNW
jgi:hypothetical protein